MRGGSRENGQATVEWIGLVVGVALVLAALVAGAGETAKGGSGRELGEAVAERITCAARDSCGLREDRVVRRRPRPVPRRAAGMGAMAPKVGGRVVGVADHAWIACLAYRRWRYELEHPQAPWETTPFTDTLDIVNECINPWEFFFG